MKLLDGFVVAPRSAPVSDTITHVADAMQTVLDQVPQAQAKATGFIKRQTFEMSLDKVESVDVNQSVLGRLMDYGDLTIQGVGEGTRTITTITSPLEFRNAITTRSPS